MIRKKNPIKAFTVEQVAQRRQSLAQLTFPENLPINQKRQEIASLLSNHQVLIVSGETGSGKSTQLPKICLEMGLADKGLIGHTQPRRLAAQALAKRIAEECQTTVGDIIGYQIRFSDHSSEGTLLKLMTDGILLAQIKHDPLLKQYQLLIIDEAHERSLNIDFILGYLKRILPKRPDLKIIITSATMDTHKFSVFFNNAPHIHVSGRNYPIETYYIDTEMEAMDLSLAELLCSTIEDIQQLEKSSGVGGHILAFFASEQQIREAYQYLNRRGFGAEQLYPLYARLPKAQQSKIFDVDTKHQKIILSTNIAETSLTVPGIRYVIDTGLVRLSQFNHRAKIQKLPIVKISKASANQRQGRCGREAPGICFRLYSEQSYELMVDETPPEILRTNLSSVVLTSIDLKLGSLDDFYFLDPPDFSAIKSALTTLEELNAIDELQRLTAIGKQMTQLTIDPRLARMIIEGKKWQCTYELCIIAAFLSIQDPREMPDGKQEIAKQFHARFKASTNPSDFESILLLWQYLQNEQKQLSRNAYRKKISKEFLNVVRIQEWRDLVKQLMQQSHQRMPETEVSEYNIASVHRACLAGLLSHIGKLDEAKVFKGARQRQFTVFPGSHLYKKPPQWLMAASLVETQKLYGRYCAPIEPQWIVSCATHLLKPQYYEPHWSRKTAQAMIYKNDLLYGLVVSEKQRVPLKSIDLDLARQLLIENVFVKNDWHHYLKQTPEFVRHNQQLFDEIKALEAKSRRLDVRIDDQLLYDLFDKRLPESIIDLKALKTALKDKPEVLNKQLKLNLSDLMLQSVLDVTEAQFPEQIVDGTVELKLSYHFDPVAIDDGVSVHIPVEKLAQLHPSIYTYLVPGLLREKSLALLRTLTKSIRKRLSPLPDLIERIFLNADIHKDEPLEQFLIKQIYNQKKCHILPSDFNFEKLDRYYLMNFKIEENGQCQQQGRDLIQLQQCHTKNIIEQVDKHPTQSEVFCDWTFEQLDDAFLALEQTKNAGLYPCLLLQAEGAVFKILSNQSKAIYHTSQSVRFFLSKQLDKVLNKILKNAFQSKSVIKAFSGGMDFSIIKKEWLQLLLSLAINKVGIPNTRLAYENNIEQYQQTVLVLAPKFEKALIDACVLKVEVQNMIDKLSDHYQRDKLDLQMQLEELFIEGFQLSALDFLMDYPRYLKAMKTRIEKLPSSHQKHQSDLKVLLALKSKLDLLYKDQPDLILFYPAVREYRFMLEEYRISLFDQSIKTKYKVSKQRLEKFWQSKVVECLMGSSSQL
jgi:ATP-dependent helicase HrpA